MNDNWIKVEIKKEILKFLELSENDNTACQISVIFNTMDSQEERFHHLVSVSIT